jgi:hypothetical protein
VSHRKIRLAALLAASAPVLAACAIQPTAVSALGPAPSVPTAANQSPAPTGSGDTQYLLLFYRDSTLTPVYRAATAGTPTEEAVLKALIAGPTRAEQNEGFVSALPADLAASPRADGLFGAYTLDEVLSQRAKAQFICTMQYYDKTISVGIEALNSNVNWNACSDTTAQYIPMPGNQSAGQGRLVPSAAGFGQHTAPP